MLAAVLELGFTLGTLCPGIEILLAVPSGWPGS
jgi:hypothetical protein